MPVIKPFHIVSIDICHPNDWNPNVQSAHIQSELLREIEEDGFDHPLQVVEFKEHPAWADETPQYKIIGGENRWKQAKAAGMTEIPIVIYDWDENTQKV